MKLNDKNKACFVCGTPYHIIQAIALASSIKYCDLYILKDYPAAKEILPNLSKLNMFNNIKLLEFRHSTFTTNIDAWIQTLKSYLFSKKQSKVFGWDNFDYEMIVFPSTASLQAAIFSAIKKNSLKKYIKLYTFDDGVFSYYKNSASFISNKNQMIRFLFFGKLGMRKRIIHLLYQPQICAIEDKYIKKVKLPSLKKNNNLHIRLNTVFNLSKKVELKNKILVFSGLWQEVYGEEGANYLKNILFQISNKVNHDVVVKKHPRDNTSFFNEFELWEYEGVPAEILFLNIPDLEEKILITDASTSCVTPKMLLEQEVRVIMLYKLLEQYKPVSKEMNDFFVKIKQSYQLQERFLIPETIDELWAFLNHLS